MVHDQTTEVYLIDQVKCEIPKLKYKETISEIMDNVVPENQEFWRNWQRFGPSKDTVIVSR